MIRKEMCFEEQIISKEKEATIFWCKIEVIVFRILQTFCNAYFFSHGMFSYEVSTIQLYEQTSISFFCNNHL